MQKGVGLELKTHRGEYRKEAKSRESGPLISTFCSFYPYWVPTEQILLRPSLLRRGDVDNLQSTRSRNLDPNAVMIESLRRSNSSHGQSQRNTQVNLKQQLREPTALVRRCSEWWTMPLLCFHRGIELMTACCWDCNALLVVICGYENVFCGWNKTIIDHSS